MAADYVGKPEPKRQTEAIENGEVPLTRDLIALKIAG
jgi:hypothetical protein